MNQSERKRKLPQPEVEPEFENQDDFFVSYPYKFRKLEEEDGYEITKKSPSLHLPSLRTPIRNCIPSYFVPKKLSDKRGKKKSNNTDHQNTILHGTNNNIICDCCHNDDPGRFIRDCQKCLVCQDCGVVKVSEVAFENELQEMQKKNKQGYKRRSYLGERLRQFSDSEPRIPEPDLEIIRYAYARLREAFNQDHPLFKKSASKREKHIERLVRTFTDREEDITKQHIKTLLDFIDHSMDPNVGITKQEKLPSFKKKYLERWAQIKKYFCGDRYYFTDLVTKPNERILDLIFKLSTLVTLIYDNKEQRDYILATSRYSYIKEEEDEEFLEEIKKRLKIEEEEEEGTPFTSSSEEEIECCGLTLGGGGGKKTITTPPTDYRYLDDPIPPKKGEKRNMPSIDLLFLMILFADGEDTLEVHGWYFVKKIMHQYTFSLPDFEDKTVSEVLLERKKKRETKYNALRLDFLVLKKILTHINQDHRAALDNIAEFAGEQIETPKNIGQLIKITAKNKSLYQFPTWQKF